MIRWVHHTLFTPSETLGTERTWQLILVYHLLDASWQS